MPQPRIPRIDVIGRRFDPFSFGPNPFGLFFGRPGAEGGVFGGGARGEPGTTRPGEPREAFVSPGVPGVIDEIIVTAPRPGNVARTGLAGIVAAGIGFIAAEFLRQTSQDRLDEFGRLATEPVFPGPDTPVIVESPVPIPEVVVTAPRMAVLRRFVLPPLPTFTPFRDLPDPFILQPIGPAPALPAPEVIPDVAIPAPQPVPRPTTPTPVPVRRPLVVPLPIPTPQTRPETTPRPSPAPLPRPVPTPTPVPTPIGVPQPFPSTRPQAQPQPQPLPITGPLTGVGTQLLPLPLGQPLPQPGARPAGCPPCPDTKKQEDQKLRDQCWKKLVKEGITADLDEEFKWVEIDCFTGAEL